VQKALHCRATHVDTSSLSPHVAKLLRGAVRHLANERAELRILVGVNEWRIAAAAWIWLQTATTLTISSKNARDRCSTY